MQNPMKSLKEHTFVVYKKRKRGMNNFDSIFDESNR